MTEEKPVSVKVAIDPVWISDPRERQWLAHDATMFNLKLEVVGKNKIKVTGKQSDVDGFMRDRFPKLLDKIKSWAISIGLVVLINGTYILARKAYDEHNRRKYAKYASHGDAAMGWKTNVWTTLNIIGGALSGASRVPAGMHPGVATAGVIGAAALAGISAYLTARGIESIVDPRQKTVSVPEEDAGKVMALLQDQGVKVKVGKKQPAASLSHSKVVKAAQRMMRRSQRLQDALMSAADEQYTRIIQVFPRNMELAMELAKKAGLEVQPYFEGRIAVTGEKDKVEGFLDTLRQRIMGATMPPGDVVLLSHELEKKLPLLPHGSKVKQLVQLAYQDLTSFNPVSPQRMRQYRALADAID